jgi:DNA-binding transcriptional regulator YhcF (GntR family)
MFEVAGNLAPDRRLPKYLAIAMENAGIPTVRQLALRASVNYHTLRDALYAGTELGVFKAQSLADALGVSLDELVRHLPRK